MQRWLLRARVVGMDVGVGNPISLGHSLTMKSFRWSWGRGAIKDMAMFWNDMG